MQFAIYMSCDAWSLPDRSFVYCEVRSHIMKN